jgi:hypothetical protein
MLFVAIVLIAALACAWGAYGPKPVFKAIAWTAGSAFAIAAVAIIAVIVHNAK